MKDYAITDSGGLRLLRQAAEAAIEAISALEAHIRARWREMQQARTD